MAKFLRIALWNANGLIKCKEELTIFLQDQLIDIMLISETHFTDKSHLKIPGHKFYHTNYPDNTAHAGIAIIIKSTIEHHLLNRYERDYLQATSLRVKTLAYEITVSAVYHPPCHQNVKKEDFKDFFQYLDPKFIAQGDFNSKHTLWGSRLITTKGRELAKVLHENSYSPLSMGTPTYWPTDPGKVLIS
jgi:exonuclease III